MELEMMRYNFNCINITPRSILLKHPDYHYVDLCIFTSHSSSGSPREPFHQHTPCQPDNVRFKLLDDEQLIELLNP